VVTMKVFQLALPLLSLLAPSNNQDLFYSPPLNIDTEDLNFSSFDYVGAATSSDTPPWQASSSSAQGSVFGRDTYYAGNSFASKQDDSYYGGDSYGAPLSPVLSTGPAAYDYGTGYGAPLAPVVSYEPPTTTTTTAPSTADTTTAVVAETTEEVVMTDLIILAACLLFFLWPRTLEIDSGNNGGTSGFFPFWPRNSNRRRKKKKQTKSTTVMSTESSSKRVETTTTMTTITNVTEAEVEKLEMVMEMEPKMEMIEDPGCQPNHPSTFVSRLRALVWRTSC